MVVHNNPILTVTTNVIILYCYSYARKYLYTYIFFPRSISPFGYGWRLICPKELKLFEPGMTQCKYMVEAKRNIFKIFLTIIF